MPVVAGIDAFREAMKGFEDSYVLIGGGACSILFDDLGLSFRATNDLDIVVLSDSMDPAFGRVFWAFIREGGYECGRREDGTARYYRFSLPVESPLRGTYPSMIELLSRHPEFELAFPTSEIAPLPFDETTSSLSAIVLDDEYYAFIKDNVTVHNGVPLLTAIHIIPLKMRAHIDLHRRHADGEHVSEKDLRKHRADVANLAGLLTPNSRMPLEGRLREDALAFLDDFEEYANRNANRKQREHLGDVLSLLKAVYL